MTSDMKKAFTIIELLVAMTLLAMLMGISGMVFSHAVRAYRTASAATEIAAKLQAVTQRLDSDFRGLTPSPSPMAIWFEYNPATGRRYDQIQFFSVSDNFTSSKQWGTPSLKTLQSNAARVYYGHANQVRINTVARIPYQNRNYNYSAYGNPIEMAKETILCRRIHLLGQLDLTLTPFPADIIATTLPYTLDYSTAVFTNRFVGWDSSSGSRYGNDVFEYDNTTFADWITILLDPERARQYLITSFDADLGRPGVDLTAVDGESLHLVLAQGVGSFSVQWAYTADDLRLRSMPDSDLNRPGFADVRWWPSTDPDGMPTTLDSDFDAGAMNATSFGCYMQFPSVPSSPAGGWRWYGTAGCVVQPAWRFASTFWPKALKFTFTLYDSSGVFKEGKTFTHIVYLNN